MSALGRDFRFTVYNATGQPLPAGGVVIRYRRFKIAQTGAPEWEATGQSITVGASLPSGQGVPSSAISNGAGGEGWMGADFIIECPQLAAAGNGMLEVFLQVSTDGGTSWPDTWNGVTDLRRGFSLASTFYDATTASRDLQARIG